MDKEIETGDAMETMTEDICQAVWPTSSPMKSELVEVAETESTL